MELYVVQEGDDLISIAKRYGITVEKLIIDNGLNDPYNLIIGQVLVITFPKQTYIVQEGDSLQSIADLYSVTIMQLLRNNPILSDRNYLYIGETLVISYNTIRSVATNGFAYPYIRKETLIRTLPNLTYLSIFNYQSKENGDIYAYQDDSEIIKTTKEYGVVPLLMITTLSQQGEPDIQLAYRILLNEESQENTINNFVSIMKNKGYQGLNIVFNFMNADNQAIYLGFAKRISARLQKEGLLFFITINYLVQIKNNTLYIEEIDYSKFSELVDGLIFLKFVWGNNTTPPAPISNINNITMLLDYLMKGVDPIKIWIGKPVIGYDWSLPYIPDKSIAFSLPITAVFDLAYYTGSIIQFDEDSQTPFFTYNQLNEGVQIKHIVWFIDARSIAALDNLIIEYNVYGSGIWNIMIYYPQLWAILVAQFDIIKITNKDNTN